MGIRNQESGVRRRESEVRGQGKVFLTPDPCLQALEGLGGGAGQARAGPAGCKRFCNRAKALRGSRASRDRAWKAGPASPARSCQMVWISAAVNLMAATDSGRKRAACQTSAV